MDGPPLSVAAEVDQLEELLTGLEFSAALTHLKNGPASYEVTAALGDWLTNADRSERDLLVIYYTGHGVIGADQRHYLLCANTNEPNLVGTGLAVDTLVSLVAQSAVQHALIVLDTCYSEAGLVDATSAIGRFAVERRIQEAAGAGYWLVATARRIDEAHLGVFVNAFSQAIEDHANGGEVQAYIDITQLVAAVNKRMKPQQRVRLAVAGSTGISPILPNPRYEPTVPPGLDVSTQRRIASDPDMRTHWDPRARGVEIESQPGEYFRGRARALATVQKWMSSTSDAHGLVVTGDPGSGKSAVLSRLVIEAHSARTEAGADGEGGGRRRIACAIYCRRKSLEDIVREVSESLLLSSEQTAACAELLASRVASDWVVVLDGLDEAEEPYRIIHEFVSPVTGSKRGARVLIGARRHLVEPLIGEFEVLDIDDPQYADVEDITEYVDVLLRAPLDDGRESTYARKPGDFVGEVSRKVAETAYPSFLIARLVARSLARAPVVTRSGDWATRLPATVPEAMEADLARYDGDTTRVTGVLRALAYTQGSGLPWEGVWAPVASALAAGDEHFDDSDIEFVLHVAGGYVVQTVESGRSVYRLYHQALVDYLRPADKDAARRAAVSKALIGTVPIEDGRVQWHVAHEYVLTHLAAHARESNMLDQLLLDEEYVIAADPSRLVRAIAAEKRQNRAAFRASSASRIAEIIELGYHGYSQGARAERPAYLAIAAMQLGSESFRTRAEQAAPVAGWRPVWSKSVTSTSRLLFDAQAHVEGIAVCDVGGQPVIVVATKSGSLYAWNYVSSTTLWHVQPFDGAAITAVTASAHDGDRVVCSSGSGPVAVIDVHSGAVIARVHDGQMGGTFAVAHALLSGRGPCIISGGYDGFLRIRPVEAPQKLSTVKAQDWWIQVCDVSANDDRTVIACAGGDGTLTIVDVGDGAGPSSQSFELGIGQISSLRVLDPAGPIVAVGSEAGDVEVVDVGKREGVRGGDAGGGKVVAITSRDVGDEPVGPVLAIYSTGAVVAWSGHVEGYEKPEVLSPPLEDRVEAYVTAGGALTWAGRLWCILGCADGTVRAVPVRNRDDGTGADAESDTPMDVQCVRGASGPMLVLPDVAGRIHTLRLETGQRMHRANVDDAIAGFAAVGCDGEAFAIINTEGSQTLHVWRLSKGTPVDSAWLEGDFCDRLLATCVGGEPYVVAVFDGRIHDVWFRGDVGELEARLWPTPDFNDITIADSPLAESILALATGASITYTYVPLADGKYETTPSPVGDTALIAVRHVGKDYMVAAGQRDTGRVRVASMTEGVAIGPSIESGDGPLVILELEEIGGELCIITVGERRNRIRIWRAWGGHVADILTGVEFVAVAHDRDTVTFATADAITALEVRSPEML